VSPLRFRPLSRAKEGFSLPLDSAVADEVKGWLKRAASDLRTAELVRNGSPPELGAAVFHCQQVAEKALKAFLVLHGRTFRKTHSIEEIGEAVLTIDDSLRSFIDRAVPLTEYAWKFRYPGEQDEPTAEEADEAIDVAREVLSAVRTRVPSEAAP